MPRKNIASNTGFTMMEMLMTIAIIGVVLIVANSSGMHDLSRAKAGFKSSLESLQIELSNLRNESMSRSTTTRMVITENNGTYTIDTFAADVAGQACSNAGTWTQIITSKPLDINGRYQLTGAAMDATCFNRDGSSPSGGDFVLAPITANAELKTATVTVTMATGFIDVDVQ